MKIRDLICLYSNINSFPQELKKQFDKIYIGKEGRVFKSKYKEKLTNVLLNDIGDFPTILLAKIISACMFLEKNQIITTPYDKNVNFNKLNNLSGNDKFRACKILTRLNKAGLLNQDSFDKTITAISKKLHVKHSSKVKKLKNKNTSFPRSEFKVIDTRNGKKRYYHFFRQKDRNDNSGTYGLVRRGYSSQSKTKVSLAIKEYHEISDSTLKVAKHEAKYHQLLYPSRKLFFFQRKGKVSLCYDWFNGAQLSKSAILDVKKLINFTMIDRLKLVISLLEQLNTLHINFRVHGDIRPANIIFDESKMRLWLIDFNMCHRPYGGSLRSQQNYAADPFVYDHSHYMIQADQSGFIRVSSKYSFCDDMYAASAVIGALFPELFYSLGGQNFVDTQKKNQTLAVNIQGIRKLVLSMRHLNNDEKNREYRAKQATSEMVLSYAKKIHDNWDILTSSLLEEILRSSIYRQEITVDDVIHGHLKPARA